MEIQATQRATEFIVAGGGKLYVWVDDDGLDYAAPSPPNSRIEFVPYAAEKFTFYQDASIGSPNWWKVEFHHLPLEHVTATWHGRRFGVPSIGYTGP